jgi:hypothetical protein
MQVEEAPGRYGCGALEPISGDYSSMYLVYSMQLLVGFMSTYILVILSNDQYW